MAKIMDLLKEAASFAIKGYESELDRRQFFIGAVGIRSDGARVKSRNSASDIISPHLHAEARLLRKLDFGAVVYVARVKRDGEWGCARPCRSCRAQLRTKGVNTVYYTIANGEYGVLHLDEFEEVKRPTGKKLHKFDPRRWHRGES